jgi:hypothetical protein
VEATQHGQAYDGGKIVVFELRSGYNGVSLAVQNLHDVSVQVTIDCKAVNALSHSGSLKASKVGTRCVLWSVVAHWGR